MDAHKPLVCHVQEGAGGGTLTQSAPAVDLDPRRRLEAGDPEPMTDFLMGSDAAITIDPTEGGILVYSETRTAIHKTRRAVAQPLQPWDLQQSTVV